MAVTNAITIKNRQPKGGAMYVDGYFTLSGTYATGGFAITAAQLGMHQIDSMDIEDQGGMSFNYVPTNDLGGVVKAYWTGSAAVAGTVGNEAAHTHAVALDTGATADESAHTHAVALDSGATGAGSSHTHTLTLAASSAGSSHTHAVALDGGTSGDESAHTHAVALDGGTTDTENAHTHAVALDGGTSADESAHTHAVALDSGTSDAGSSHNHAFTGTAITPDTFTVVHNAAPATAALYVLSFDGVMGFFCCDNSADSASDYFQTAGGERYAVLDDSASALVGTGFYFPVYFIDDGGTLDKRLVINNTITGKDIYVRGSAGGMICLTHNAGAATEDAVFFDDDGADATLRLNGTLDGAATVTTSTTDDTYKGLVGVCAGANAAEAAHTHGPGTLADAASGAGSAHSHGPGTLADAASGVGSAHSHGPGTLADAASGAGSAHNHGPGTLVDAASGAEAAHTHTLTGTTVDAEAAHTHGYGTLADAASGAGSAHSHGYGTLADAASGVGSSHTHSFTGTGTTAATEAEVTATTSMAAYTVVYFEAVGH